MASNSKSAPTATILHPRPRVTAPVAFGVVMPAFISFTVFGIAWLAAPRWVETSLVQNSFRDDFAAIIDADQTTEAATDESDENNIALLLSTQETESTPQTTDPEANSISKQANGGNIDPVKKIVNASYPEYKLLLNRYDIIHERTERYSAMSNFFYRLHFALIWAATTSTIMLAVSAGGSFLGTYNNNSDNSKDNQQTHKILRTLFLSTTAMSLLFFNLPGILKLGDNRRTSWELVGELNNLSNRIDTFITTGGVTTVDTVDDDIQLEFEHRATNLFIHYIDQELNRLHQLPVDFDQSAITRISSFESNSMFPQKAE